MAMDPLRLPPGVYFNPGHEESVHTYLNRCIAGEEMADVEGFINCDDVYSVSPDVLARRYPPGNTRNPDSPKWWFFSNCKVQLITSGSRGRRRVATGGFWRLQQSTKDVLGGEAVGHRCSLAFFTLGADGKEQAVRRRWLVEEYTTGASLDGLRGGQSNPAVPALYRMYLSPRCDKDKKKKKRDASAEDGQAARPVRVVVPAAYFKAIADRMPPGSVRGLVQEHAQSQLQGTGEAPPGVSAHQQEPFVQAAPPPHLGVSGHCQEQSLQVAPPPQPSAFGNCQKQFLQTAPPLPPPPHLGHYYQEQSLQAAPPLPPPPSPGICGQEQFLQTAPPLPGVFVHHREQYLLHATPTPPPPPSPPPCVLDNPFQDVQFLEVGPYASAYEHGEILHEDDAMVGEMGSLGGLSDGEGLLWMMDAEALSFADMTWIEDYQDQNESKRSH